MPDLGPGVTHLKDLTPDPTNRRAHNPRNLGMLVDSLHTVGAARSIVIDEAGVILAGNGVVEAAAEAGITHVQVVDVDGQTVVAVRRTGLSDAQKRALALYDNRTAELASWSVDQLRLDAAAGLDLQPFFTDDEQAALLTTPDADAWAAASTKLGAEHSGFIQIAFTLTAAQLADVQAALAAALAAGPFGETGNANKNGNALARICAAYLTTTEPVG